MDKRNKTIVGSGGTPPITEERGTVVTPADVRPRQLQAVQTPPPTVPMPPQATPPTSVPTPAYTPDTTAPQPSDAVTPTQPPTTVPTPNYMPTITPRKPTYTSVDERNQALSGKVGATVEPPKEEEIPMQQTVQAVAGDGKSGNPVILTYPVSTGASDAVRAEQDTPDDDEGGIEVGGKRYKSYTDAYADLAKLTSDEDKEREMRRERRNAIIGAVGDGLASLSNLYFTTRGAPDQGLKPNLTEASLKRMDDLRARWQAEKDKYDALMLKGIEADREQGNWLSSYRQKEAEQRQRLQKFLEIEKPKAEAEIEKTRLEIEKIKDDKEIDDATRAKRLEAKQKELDTQIATYNFKLNNGLLSPAEAAKQKEDGRHNRATEANQRRGGKKDKEDKTYTISSTMPGMCYRPTAQQIDDAYAYLAGRNFVAGEATTTEGKAREIQKYYRVKGRKTRIDDEGGGPRVDEILGGRMALNYQSMTPIY